MTTTESVCYKIRDKRTGLWSAGGTEPRFNKLGKTWSGSGPLLNHLAQFRHGYGHKITSIPENWEVVTFWIVVNKSEDAVIGAREMYERHKANK